jgi:Flp pilus assembly protein TadG
VKVLLSKSRTIFRDSQGSQVAELALVVPILLMVFMGILWFGRAFNIYTTLNRAARDGAQAAAAHTCASCGNAPAVDADVQTNVINPIIIAAHLDPSQCAQLVKVSATMQNIN